MRSDLSISLSVVAPLPEAPENAAARVRVLIDQHYDFVWRLLRRMGLSAADAEDATQQVFINANRHIGSIHAGKERAFLVSTAFHELRHQRRGQRRRRVTPDEEAVASHHEPTEPPDELVDQRRAREMLDAIVVAMPDDLRIVFVLFEIEEIPTTEIAELLDVPAGTVASRLRRAREDFQDRLARLQARATFAGGRR